MAAAYDDIQQYVINMCDIFVMEIAAAGSVAESWYVDGVNGGGGEKAAAACVGADAMPSGVVAAREKRSQ